MAYICSAWEAKVGLDFSSWSHMDYIVSSSIFIAYKKYGSCHWQSSLTSVGLTSVLTNLGYTYFGLGPFYSQILPRPSWLETTKMC